MMKGIGNYTDLARAEAAKKTLAKGKQYKRLTIKTVKPKSGGVFYTISGEPIGTATKKATPKKSPAKKKPATKKAAAKKKPATKKATAKKRTVSQKSINVLKTLNKTADNLQKEAGTTDKVIKVQKLPRQQALKKAGKLYKNK